MLWELGQCALAIVCAILGGTFLVGLVKTFMEGPEALAVVDRAGLTFGAFWNGTVPYSDSIMYQSGAEISIEDGVFHAVPTGTVRKSHS